MCKNNETLYKSHVKEKVGGGVDEIYKVHTTENIIPRKTRRMKIEWIFKYFIVMNSNNTYRNDGTAIFMYR